MFKTLFGSSDQRHAVVGMREQNTRLAFEVDRLTALLRNSHYRDPTTGRLSPLGQFPSPEGN